MEHTINLIWPFYSIQEVSNDLAPDHFHRKSVNT